MIKNKFILVGRDGRPSMKKVYTQMQNNNVDLVIRRKPNGIEKLHVYSNNTVDERNPLRINNLTFQDKIVIRWGNRIEAETNEHTIIYNKASAIQQATDKALSRVLFTEENISTPRLFNYDAYLQDEVTYPVIARPRVHSKGRHFVVLNNAAEFVNHYRENEVYGWYYSEFIDKQREFRVHCGHGKVLTIMEKPKAEGIAWNRAINNDPFVRVKQADYDKDVCLQALSAIKALGLDFGGVDVVFKDGKAYVLEVNTSPTLNSSEYVSQQYAKYFDWLLRSDTRRPHWDYQQFRKASSLAWKQEQFLN